MAFGSGVVPGVGGIGGNWVVDNGSEICIGEERKEIVWSVVCRLSSIMR